MSKTIEVVDDVTGETRSVVVDSHSIGHDESYCPYCGYHIDGGHYGLSNGEVFVEDYGDFELAQFIDSSGEPVQDDFYHRLVCPGCGEKLISQ